MGQVLESEAGGSRDAGGGGVSTWERGVGPGPYDAPTDDDPRPVVPTPAAATAGRFVLLSNANGVVAEYVTSWDTWEEAEAAFPIGWMCFLRDDETGREWLPGAPYEWDAPPPATTGDDNAIAF